MRILVVEDEVKLAKAIKAGLEQESYAADIELDGEAGLSAALAMDYDLIISDWMMPELSGPEMVKQLRNNNSSTPVLMLTAKDSVTDKVGGLDSGADDYLVKPFAFEELLARVRSLLRRPKQAQTTILRYSDLELDPAEKTVSRSDQSINLSSKEFALLEYFLRNPEKNISKDSLIEHVWDFDSDILPNTVEAFIKQLRVKVDKPFKSKTLIQTVRGVGYKLEEER